MKISKICLISAFLLLFTFKSGAQTGASEEASPTNNDTQTINEIDLLLKQDSQIGTEDSKAIINRPITAKELKKLNISDYSKINSTTGYDDYSAVQKNYMPKSSRLQIKTGISTAINDVFYTNLGINLGAIYNFTEMWGVGVGGSLLTSNKNAQTQNIRDVQLVNVENLVTLKNTYNASIYFSPIYGKWTFLNKKILPFEIYFSGGFGQIMNQSDLASTSSVFSAGQLISLTRSSALDINLQVLMYTTKNINNQDQSNNSLLLTVSYSVFWPKPDYR